MIDCMKTDGNEADFWKNIGFKPKGRTWVSDSHAYVYSLLHGIGRVVLFDAHHDCWYGDSLGIDKTDRNIYCHNWLLEWLRGSKNRKAVWVKPEWQDAFELPDDMKKKVEVVVYSKGMDLGLEGTTIHHICRSGCWVPPWLDKAFLGFVGGLRGSLDHVIPMQEGSWNPLQERWTEVELNDAIESGKKVREMMWGLKTGTVQSSEFLNCRVQQSV